MATASSLLSEEKFLCSVCLDVFTEPVTAPCGHTFCRACIHKYWDSTDICQCPFCKQIFSPKPELQVNTVMSELAAGLKMLAQVKPPTPDPEVPETADVVCDICSETKEKAVKSCLTCLTSFCEVHLEPHQRIVGLRSHTLLDPVRNLDDRMCKTHTRLTELYCRTDQACICVLCMKIDHKGHDMVSLDEEYEAMMAKKDKTMANIQKMIQTCFEKIAEIENAVDVRQKEAEREKAASVQVLADLILSIQRSQAELVEAIDERFRAAKQKAEGFLSELKMEVAELESRRSQLEQLSQSEDHHPFIQSFPTLSSPSDKDWTKTGVGDHLTFEAFRDDVTLLKQRVSEIIEGLPEIRMKRMREHAVDLTFDPDTAYRSLVISQDGKQARFGNTDQNFPVSPKRFENYPQVLAKEGFTTGKFYYEVQVKGKIRWVVGVARESVDRKEKQTVSVAGGYWIILFNEGVYKAGGDKLSFRGELEKVGIFVDYEEGRVSFYDVDSKSHIYSFFGNSFTETLYPQFCPQTSMDGKNSAPMIITPVPETY